MSFTEQFGELMRGVPKMNLFQRNNENCDYTNDSEMMKDCYLVFNARDCKNCYYSSAIGRGGAHDLVDCLWCLDSSVGYRNIDCKTCYSCFFCDGCNNCSFCFDCSGISNKKYYIKNRKHTKDEYETTIKDIKKEKTSIPRIQVQYEQSQTENCFGMNIKNSSNCMFSHDMDNSENCSYCSNGIQKSSYDCFNCGTDTQWLYESVGSYFNQKLFFSNYCQNSFDTYYSDTCYYCKDCFGCIGLRNKQYCIFNKQYTKEQYNELVPKIIGHMTESGERGEFFDPSLSPFGYNETVAQEYFPLRRDDALARPGYQRQDNNYDPKIPDGVPTFTGDQIPSDIMTVTDDILKKIFICEISGRPFRIIRQELDFYRKHNLPLPRKHPDVRHEERLAQRPPRELHLRHCDKCGKEMVSVYRNIEGSKDGNIEGSKDGNIGDVYCESCYQQEIYG